MTDQFHCHCVMLQKSCWLHYESECGKLEEKSGCDHYRFVDCKDSEFDELSELGEFTNKMINGLYMLFHYKYYFQYIKRTI